MAGDKGKEKLTFSQKVYRQCRSFANFSYNKETGEVMGRSGKSWAKIGLFYLAYYGFLAAFFSSCLAIFLSMLNEPGKGGPKNIQFLVGDSAPGLNTLPSAALLKTQTSKPNAYANAIDSYLKVFEDTKTYTGPSCSGSTSAELCVFNSTDLGDCGRKPFAGGYGVSNYTCVFVKMNKVYGWKPKSNIGLSCSGAPNLEVLPKTGYYADGFPFKGQDSYQTPPVAVKIPQKGNYKIKCELSGDGIKTSDVFIAHRAYGKIEFEVSS